MPQALATARLIKVLCSGVRMVSPLLLVVGAPASDGGRLRQGCDA
jgi:hypothetical protein